MVAKATATALLAAIAIAVAGCNDDSENKSSAGPAVPSATAPAQDTRIIRRWSELLLKGKVDAATGLFSVPATVQNGTGPLLLDSRQQVFGFNESLPCGAKLLSTTRREPYTIATFRLTERPGGDCGTGGGHKAATAFRIEDGKIVEWLRVPVPREQPRPDRKPPPPSDRESPGDTV